MADTVQFAEKIRELGHRECNILLEMLVQVSPSIPSLHGAT